MKLFQFHSRSFIHRINKLFTWSFSYLFILFSFFIFRFDVLYIVFQRVLLPCLLVILCWFHTYFCMYFHFYNFFLLFIQLSLHCVCCAHCAFVQFKTLRHYNLETIILSDKWIIIFVRLCLLSIFVFHLFFCFHSQFDYIILLVFIRYEQSTSIFNATYSTNKTFDFFVHRLF